MYTTKYLSTYPLPDSLTLLVNSLTGALDVLDDSKWKLFQRIGTDGSLELPQDFDLLLRERGYVFDDESEESALVQRMLETFETGYTRPIRIVVCPTFGCPMRCTYCFEGDIRASKRVLNTEEIVQIFKVSNELRKGRAQDVTTLELFGGEPFYPVLARPALEDIFPRARDNGYAIIAITNGVHLTEYRDLLSKYSGCLDGAQITMDGPKEIHDQRRVFANGKGTFDRVVQGVECLLELGVRVSIRVNVDRQNIDYLPEFADFIVDRGWPDAGEGFVCELSPVTDHHGSGALGDSLMPEHEIVAKTLQMCKDHPHMLKLARLYMFRVLNHITVGLGLRKGLISTPTYHYCEACNMEYFVFGTDHLVYVCPETIGISKYAIGRYYPTLEIDDDKAAMWQERHVFNIPECRECNIAAFCGGGCAYAALVKHDHTRHPVCDNAPQILAAFVDTIKDDIVARYHAIRDGREQPTSNIELVLSTMDSCATGAVEPATV